MNAVPATFEGENALSIGIVRAMESDEGVAVVQGLYGPQDTYGLDIDYPANPTNADEVPEAKLRANFSGILDLIGPISEQAKQTIIDMHLGDFPIKLSTSDIGFMRIETLTDNRGSMPHIDQQDHRHGNWLPPQFYTGVSFVIPLFGTANWRTWSTQTYALLDNMGTKDPLPIVKKANGPGDENIELVTDESGVAFRQDVGDIVIVRQGDIIHRVREIQGPRIRAIGDITCMLDERDLNQAEIQQALEWAEERRNNFLKQAVVKSAVRLEPAQ